MKKWGTSHYILALFFLSLMHFVFALRTNTFFSVDDFAILGYLKDHTIIQMVFDFLINGDIYNFRRLIGFIAFGGIFKIFGVNHLVFDIAMLLTNTGNLILLFFVVRKLSKNDFASFFVSLIFNKNYLFYYSNLHEHLLAFFCILTIFFFIYYPHKFYLSLVSFILALFTKETAFTVPLILYALSFFSKLQRKNIFYLLIISILYGIYASYFFITKKVVIHDFSYTPISQFIDLFRGYLYYVDYRIILLCLVLPIFFNKLSYIFLFIVFILTLTPASFLVNRREAYYLYMPFAYLMIYVSLFLPKLNFKSSFFYIFVFLVFGGRSVLPKIAWHEFPNWQKISINQVLDRVESGRSDFSDLNLERDAKLMIESNTTSLFMNERNSLEERGKQKK